MPQQYLVGIHSLHIQACCLQTPYLKQHYFSKAVGTNKVYPSNWKASKVVLPWWCLCFCQELEQNKKVQRSWPYTVLLLASPEIFFDNTKNLIKDKCHSFLQLKKKNRLTLTCHEVAIPSFENHWDALEVKTYCRTAAQTTSQWVQEKLCTVPKFRSRPSGNIAQPQNWMSTSSLLHCSHLGRFRSMLYGSISPTTLPFLLVTESFSNTHGLWLPGANSML